MDIFKSVRALILSLALTFVSQSSFAHGLAPELFTHDELNQLHLIDTGNGDPQWMRFEDALKLAEKSHENGRCGGFMDLTDQIPVTQDMLAPVELFSLNLTDRQLTQRAYLSQALGNVDAQKLFKTVSDLSTQFKNRYYKGQTGVQAIQWLAGQYQAIAKNRSDVKIETFRHTRWDQPSLIVTIPGQGPNAKEIVVIGGHADSINMGGGGQNMSAPGADDNATGTATVLEVFRVLVETGFKPNRTMMFMAYAGEELGLLGSQEVANSFKQQGRSVVAVAQFDMTGFPGAGNQIVFINDHVSSDLTKFSQKLVDTYVKVPWSNDRCGYACSDHASWTKAGYPSIFPFEATMSKDNKAIHSTGDVIQKLDFNHGVHYAKLGLAFMAELSK